MAAGTLETILGKIAKEQPVAGVLLLGSDSYLRMAARRQIVDAAVDPASRDWALAHFSAEDGDANASAVLGQARTVPMLARRQVVIWSDLECVEKWGEKSRDAAIAAIAEYLADPAPFTILVMEADGLDQRMKLAKTLADKAVIISAELPADPLERGRIAAKLALQMARERGASIESEAAQELADLCNADLAAIGSEIAKLATYAGRGKTITRGDVLALVVSEKKYSVWELADMLAARQRPRALAFLDNLLREGEAPPALVGAMGWMFRKLLEAQELGGNVTQWQAAGKLGMRAATAEIALRQSRRIPRAQLVNGLRALYDADSRLKSAAADDRAIMEFLVVRLTATD